MYNETNSVVLHTSEYFDPATCSTCLSPPIQEKTSFTKASILTAIRVRGLYGSPGKEPSDLGLVDQSDC